MAGFRIGLLFIACLVVQQQGVLTYFITSYCGNFFPRPSARINNGETTGLGTAPFMAFLYTNSGYRCGGSIITERYILTAGHCLAKGLKVRLGEYDTRTNPDCHGFYCFPSIQNYEIENTIRHRGYNDITLANDIALLKLKTKIIFNANTQPVCLLSQKYLPQINKFEAFGWGFTGNGSLANVLQTTKLYHYDNGFCNAKLNDTLTNFQFCAAARKSDTCRGDSGGPLVRILRVNKKFLYVQLGLVSFGDKECRGVGAYTHVPRYWNWIWNMIKINGT